MKVFLHHVGHKRPVRHTLHIAPAADRAGIKGEVPTEWVNDKNEPVTFIVEFNHGVAEVSDSIGKYLIDRGMAKKTKLIMPEIAA